jgi:hypothetical protein
MARLVDDEVDESSAVGHLTAVLPVFDSTSTKIVRRASQKMVRATSGSFGKQIHVEEITPPDLRDKDNWFRDDEVVPVNGPKSGFAKYESMRGSQESDYDRYPIERQLDPIAEEKRILAAAARVEQADRILKDPETNIPTNWAATDKQPESDKFYGRNKEPETNTVMKRMKDVDRKKEKVDYNKAKSVPITFIS